MTAGSLDLTGPRSIWASRCALPALAYTGNTHTRTELQYIMYHMNMHLNSFLCLQEFRCPLLEGTIPDAGLMGARAHKSKHGHHTHIFMYYYFFF